MATLHVRNFPDAVYETLRSRAETNGRSIGAEAVDVIARELSRPQEAGSTWAGRRRRAARRASFQRFTPLARGVVGLARNEARALGHDHVRTEHLLLGILQGAGTGGRCLEALGLTVEQVRLRCGQVPAAAPEPGASLAPGSKTAEIPFGPDSKKALELALRESLSMRQTAIGTEHVLLGIAAEGESLGAQIVRELEPSRGRLRSMLIGESMSHLQFGPPAGGPDYRVLELAGAAAAWETALNAAVDEGFDLVEIVGDRAVLRRG
jgi:ATP-dependent Clp protease ATP-binding subunit ClpC